MTIKLADHYGMCFGVRDALRRTHETAALGPVTVLGELVHNPVVHEHLATLGVRRGSLQDRESAMTERVIITAHGAADRDREAWKAGGHAVTDTTCPLVRKAHHALAVLTASGFHPVVIGQPQHAEVRGLTGDFPHAAVVQSEADIDGLPVVPKLGVVSQTTQPIDRVRNLVECIRRARPESEVVFRDTVCQPTKDRQTALEKLCRENDTIIVVGGRNSNNTRQLVLSAQKFGARAWQVETAADLNDAWLRGASSVGVTAGTSTLDETVQEVVERLKQMAAGA